MGEAPSSNLGVPKFKGFQLIQVGSPLRYGKNGFSYILRHRQEDKTAGRKKLIFARLVNNPHIVILFGISVR